MKRMSKALWLVIFCYGLLLIAPTDGLLAKKAKNKSLTLPNSVLSIEKTNTYANTAEDIEIVEPNSFTKDLLEEVDVNIENPEIIKILNESTIKTTPISFGYDANIYLGRWPLHYQSEDTKIIRDYMHINSNELSNSGGNGVQQLSYNQQTDKVVKGALTNKIDHQSMIKKMILQKLQEKVDFPLAYETRVGVNTKLNHLYNVEAEKTGLLEAYVPAMQEKGKIVYGDIYLASKGSHAHLKIKNVTKQEIGAWIPIQNHLSLSYTLK
ncbi:MAG TPA: YfkD family protein [Pseudogracilibacillus sp.]|nr:YfkD family protein [Pseudogracilibacillus sp.]